MNTISSFEARSLLAQAHTFDWRQVAKFPTNPKSNGNRGGTHFKGHRHIAKCKAPRIFHKWDHTAGVCTWCGAKKGKS